MPRAARAAHFAVVLFALALGLLPRATPARADDAPAPPPAMDFWEGIGRFKPNALMTDDEIRKIEPPDLSGVYASVGHSTPGVDSTVYHCTLTLKRKLDPFTPQGRRITTWEMRWDWASGKPTKGIGLLIGHRLYFAYGNDEPTLYAFAPLRLVDAEAKSYARWMQLEGEAESRNAHGKKNEYTSVSGAPWFTSVWTKDHADAQPAYYCIWTNFWGLWGDATVRAIPAWENGSYDIVGTYLDGKGRQKSSLDSWDGRFGLKAQGKNFEGEQQIHNYAGDGWHNWGNALPLPDGTVVAAFGIDKDAGVGYYEVTGAKLTGEWAYRFAAERGEETLTPSAEVLAKNPTFFKP